MDSDRSQLAVGSLVYVLDGTLILTIIMFNFQHDQNNIHHVSKYIHITPSQ